MGKEEKIQGKVTEVFMTKKGSHATEKMPLEYMSELQTAMAITLTEE